MTTQKNAVAKKAATQAAQQPVAIEIKDMTHAHIIRSVLSQNKGAVLNDTLVIGISQHIKELCEDLDKQQAGLNASAASSKAAG